MSVVPVSTAYRVSPSAADDADDAIGNERNTRAKPWCDIRGVKIDVGLALTPINVRESAFALLPSAVNPVIDTLQ